MKNVKNLFGMAVMATALVGCSSNDNLNPNANDNGGKTGEAYASFKINLPTTSGTRATAGEPTFDYGDAAEYAVKNGTILIFDANTDKFVTSAELGTMNPWTDVKDNKGVTTSAIATVQLSNVSVKGKYKALVLLNNDVDDGTTKVTKVTLPTTTDTYASWSKETANVNADKYLSTDGFFMANAPMYSTTTDPTTLVEIKNVCASREEAQAKAATVVYVERGLAKVTMKNFDANYPITEGTYKGDNVVITNWQLDVTNNSTFPVHQTGTLSTSFAKIWETPRFFDGDNATFKRVYWGVDPNYDTDVYQTDLDECKKAFKMIKNNEVKGVAGTPQYCLENTFNLANMKQGQTTRVVFKAVFTPQGTDFKAGDTFYKIGNNTAIWSGKNLEAQIKAKAQEVLKEPDASKVKVKLDASTNNLTVAGVRLVNDDNVSLVIDDEGTTRKLNKAEVNDLNTKLGLHEATTTDPKVGISTYYNGEAYYIARIKHFNELTKWNAGESYFDVSNQPLNEKFLGRYGVLRNNWYDLSVKNVSGLGYPEVPDVKPNVPDDENDKYINVEVKILDWAKRSQSIDL